MNIQGHYLDGKTSGKATAFLEVNQSSSSRLTLTIQHASQTLCIFLNFDDLKFSSRLGNTPREVMFGDDELFITEDNEAIDNLIKQYKEQGKVSLLFKLESNLKLVALASIVTGFMIWSTVVYGIPALAKSIAFQLPSSVTSDLGSTLDILDTSVFSPTEIDIETQNRIQDLVAPHIGAHLAFSPKLYFRKGMKANAIALPNGQIVFTDEFVKLANHDEELLAVFFHELGHLKHKHLARRILQDSMITLLVIFISGDVDSIDIVTGLPTVILDLAYSRDFEVEADTYALDQLHKNNIPVERFATMMQRLDDYYSSEIFNESQHYKKSSADITNKEDNDLNKPNQEIDSGFTLPDFLSTHPTTGDRIQFVKDYKKKHNIK
jgi:Zn-dependent protease with chaperone function